MTPADELFDRYTENYGVVLEDALTLTGEGQDFYAWQRVTFLASLFHRLGRTAAKAMDFGCSVGGTTPHLLKALSLQRLIGIDVSRQSIETANRRFASDRVRFLELNAFTPDGSFDLVYCNGVFHHIDPAERADSLRYICKSLRPGGTFALWENNPWNPGTRCVMHHCEFDKDAITLSPPTAKRLVKEAGLDVIRTDFLFIFPHALKSLRWLEGSLSRMPLGGQYQVLAKKPC